MARMNNNAQEIFQIHPSVHVAVTGHRILPQPEVERITAQVREVLEEIRDAAVAIYRENTAFFARRRAEVEPRLRLISPLSEGSDRLAACEALSLGYELQCPLPFAREFYETTFGESDPDHTEFRGLLNRADAVFELAAGNEQFTSQAYADIAEILLNHADLLIAIWNGQPGRYIAGTYATIAEAVRNRIPVLIIPESAPGNGRTACISYRDGNREVAAWREALRSRLRRVLLPRAAEIAGVAESPLFPVPQSLPKPAFEWQGFVEKCLLKKDLEKKQDAEQAAPAAPKQPDSLWQRRKKCCSSWVAAYGSHYRNSMLGRQFLPLLAAVFLTLALYCQHFPFLLRLAACFGASTLAVQIFFYALQIACLSLSLFLVYRDRKKQFHRRFVSYRVMAELCRQTSFLYPMGFCNVSYRHRSNMKEKGESEVSWYYRMLLRTDGLPHSTLTHEDLKEWLLWLERQFVMPQMKYHAKRKRRCGALQGTIASLVTVFFNAGIVVTLCRESLDVFPCGDFKDVFSALALVLPNIAVLFASLSNNSGYPVHYGISCNMQDFFSDVHEDIQSLLNRQDGEITYSDVMRICHTINDYCRDELSDWEDTIHSCSLKWM